ncbi:hypothetical protein JRO89_XS13G0018200 [Xanthoceras sorbifolium]|uniref:Uncharacterized protein n=1 Tax=Xanthoceras sorbifolium TaxID=99658 RepID=A0ABQ8H603_9ROSI|nr:hypothetical protein JRO89_XS13G0018200 [Xanthoceras sorbifolium]
MLSAFSVSADFAVTVALSFVTIDLGPWKKKANPTKKGDHRYWCRSWWNNSHDLHHYFTFNIEELVIYLGNKQEQSRS